MHSTRDGNEKKGVENCDHGFMSSVEKEKRKSTNQMFQRRMRSRWSVDDLFGAQVALFVFAIFLFVRFRTPVVRKIHIVTLTRAREVIDFTYFKMSKKKNKQPISEWFLIQCSDTHKPSLILLVWKLQPNAPRNEQSPPARSALWNERKISPTMHNRCERVFRVNIDAQRWQPPREEEWEREGYTTRSAE